MSISAYASSLTIPPYPGPSARTSDTKPAARDTVRNDVQTQLTSNRTESSVPSTGLLNTVV